MKTKLAFGLAALLLAASGCGKSSAPPVPPAPPPPAERPKAPAGDVAEAAKGINAFALDLYAKLADEKKGENIFFSPYSISTALSMTYAGARGNTAAEMKKTLRFALGDAKLHPAMGALVSDLNAAGAKGGFQLSVANALWMQQGHKFLPEFLNLNKTSYGAGLETLDFAKNTEGSRKTINAWVEKQTQEKIKDLVPPGALDNLTRLVLTNAIYFKGNWEKQFNEAATEEKPFKLGGGKTVNVPTMWLHDHFDYAEGDGFQAVELPYKGSRLAMLVLLPDKEDGLPMLEKALSLKQLADLKLSRTDPIILLPRFKLTSEFRLDKQLKALGLNEVFSQEKADLSGINGLKPPNEEAFHISAVLHKAFVDVNEKGTEAAAATAGIAQAGNGHSPKRFFADHPFLFLIRDKATGCILFIGRVLDPKNDK